MPITIAGVVLPESNPAFLVTVGIHIFFGIVCVVAATVALLLKKTSKLHPKVGLVYFWGLLIVYVSTCVLVVMRWPEDNHLLILGTLSIGAMLVAYFAKRRQWKYWPRIHFVGMGISFIAMLTAFYVDNGKNLPLWNLLPEIAFWFIPSLVGVPLMIVFFQRNPLTKSKKAARMGK